MRTKTRLRTALVIAGLVTIGSFTGVPATAQTDRTDTGPVMSTAVASGDATAAGTSTEASIRAFWTEARMKSAKPADATPDGKASAKAVAEAAGPPVTIAPAKPVGATPSTDTSAVKPSAVNQASDWYGPFWSPPATTTGKVFFTHADGTYRSCSGSAVNSEAKNTVFTAGHCVSDGQGHWHSNWVFVPDYYYGYQPFGMWVARELGTLGAWFSGSDFRFDIGAAVMYDNGDKLVNTVGGQGIAWNQPHGLYVHAFGYPADPPYDGERLKYCEGYTYSDPWSGWANLGLDCDMTPGASGGPWLAYFDGTFGYVNGVNSYKYSWLPGSVYSPYFGSLAGSLYDLVRYRY